MSTKVIGVGSRIADYASPNISLIDLKAKGYVGVVRYINGDTGKGKKHWKIITTPERDAIVRMGLGLLLVFEKSADTWKGGYSAGLRDGKEAAVDVTLLRYDGPVLVAYDSDVVEASRTTAVAYWRGFRAGLSTGNPVGVYGDFDLFDALQNEGNPPSIYWQANAAAWSWKWLKGVFVKRIHPQTHVMQLRSVNITSGSIDPNDVLRPITMWDGPDKAISYPTPPPAVVIEPLIIPQPTLRLGTHSWEVVKWQQALQFWGWMQSIVDGEFGEATAAGTRWAQAVLKVKQDGVYGPVTATAYRNFAVSMRNLAQR
jgi:hypothetical protein